MITREALWDLPAPRVPGELQEEDLKVVAEVRKAVKKTLISWGMASVITEVLIIVSELCTNAIRHGEPPVTLILRAAGPCLGGEVRDQGKPFVPRQRSACDGYEDALSLDAETGRGLVLVGALTDDWDVDPAMNGAGKAVWWQRRVPAIIGSPDHPA